TTVEQGYVVFGPISPDAGLDYQLVSSDAWGDFVLLDSSTMEREWRNVNGQTQLFAKVPFSALPQSTGSASRVWLTVNPAE
ncbi:MAG: hypothetical protein Q7P63_12205, partial [Verrucomicrobiota bacterium JB022]|nr:hypothetical protein [Verrucomicrobiota bacterium JB022]